MKRIEGKVQVFYCMQYHPLNVFHHHLPDTGPEACTYCKQHGTFRQQWLGYCVGCAQNVYKFTRGAGFQDGVEVDGRRLDAPVDCICLTTSVYASDEAVVSAFLHAQSIRTPPLQTRWRVHVHIPAEQ